MNKQIERLITAAGIAALVVVFCYQVAYGKMSKEYMYGFDLEKKQCIEYCIWLLMTHVMSEQSNSLLDNILYINDFTNYCQR